MATAKISDHDAVIFYNFRPDRAREITRSLCDPDFDGFQRESVPQDLKYICFTEYDVTIPNKEVAFKPQKLKNTLGEYISSGAEAAQNGGNRKICTRYVFLQRRRGGTQSQ